MVISKRGLGIKASNNGYLSAFSFLQRLSSRRFPNIYLFLTLTGFYERL